MSGTLYLALLSHVKREFFLFFSTISRSVLVRYTSGIIFFITSVRRYSEYVLWKGKKILIQSLMKRQRTVSVATPVTVATVSFSFVLGITPMDTQGVINLHIEGNADATANAIEEFTLLPKRIVFSDEDLPSPEQILEHTVETGDTLSGIAEKYLVPVDAIAYVNDMDAGAFLRPGETLTIPPLEGLTHTVKDDESIASIAEKYNVSPQVIVDANVLKPPFDVFTGDLLVIPGGEVPAAPVQSPVVLATTTVVPTTSGLSLESIGESSGGKYIMPTPGVITQYSSYYHMALDISQGCGQPIWASQNGTVVYSGARVGGYGIMVELVHSDGRVSQYAHMSQTAALLGQTVTQGEIIGYTGATGIAYGCHLHFVIKDAGRAINPLAVM